MKQDKRENNLPEKWSYTLKVKRFADGKPLSGTKRTAYADPSFVASKINEEPYWTFAWEDLPPHRISWEQTLVGIEESKDGILWSQLQQNGQPLDDRGYDIAVILKDVTRQGTAGIYETRWYNPPVGEKDKYFRFVILPQKEQDYIYSKSFR